MRDEQRELKEWLRGLKPEDLSRADVAYELSVSRKTITTMLNPHSEGFANGLTMLRYLRLVGALVDAPEADATGSRLAALEKKVDEVIVLLERALLAIQELRPQSEDGRSGLAS